MARLARENNKQVREADRGGTKTVKAQIVGSRTTAITGKENRRIDPDYDVDGLLGEPSKRRIPGSASKPVKTLLVDRTDPNPSRTRSPLIPKETLPKSSKTIARQQFSSPTSRNRDLGLLGIGLGPSRLRHEIGGESTMVEEDDNDDEDEEDEFDLLKRGTETGNLHRGPQKGRLSDRTKMLEPISVRKQDTNDEGLGSEDDEGDVFELVSPRIGDFQHVIDDDETLSKQKEEEAYYLRKLKTPLEIKEQQDRRDVAFSAAQEKQIQEITENLNPLCKDVQKIYIKSAKETQPNMIRQCIMHKQEIGSEMNALAELVGDHEKISGELDTEIETVRGRLRASLERKKTVLQQGQKDLRKAETRQKKEMQHVQAEFEGLYDVFSKKLDDIEDPDARRRYLAHKNPGVMTLSGTNCYLVTHASGADLTLIDTGSPEPSAPAFVKLLVNHLKETNGVIRNIVLTHHHIDHVGGLDCVLTNLDTTGAPEPRIYKHMTAYSASSSSSTSRSVVADDDLQVVVRRHSRNGGGIIWLEAGTDIELGKETGDSSKLRVLHTPGHTADSISLWLEDTGELFVGDTILGYLESFVEHSSIPIDMDSLRLLQSLGATTLYPGHGPHIEGQQAVSAKITEYIDHRLQRESQIIKALEADSIGSASTAAELVHAIYPDLPMRAVFAAEQSVTAHLDKLCADGAVERTSEMDPHYTLLVRNATTR